MIMGSVRNSLVATGRRGLAVSCQAQSEGNSDRGSSVGHEKSSPNRRWRWLAYLVADIPTNAAVFALGFTAVAAATPKVLRPAVDFFTVTNNELWFDDQLEHVGNKIEMFFDTSFDNPYIDGVIKGMVTDFMDTQYTDFEKSAMEMAPAVWRTAADVLRPPVEAWEKYALYLHNHPIATQAAIAATVYILGDLIAQSYRWKGRWAKGEPTGLDIGRTLCNGLVGGAIRGPLSGVFYDRLDLAVAHLRGQWAPVLAQVAVSETAWALSWNTIYYMTIGTLKGQGLLRTWKSVRDSGWMLLTSGWRIWPVAGLVTYGLVPVEHRVLWVESMELAWAVALAVRFKESDEVDEAFEARQQQQQQQQQEQLVAAEAPEVAIDLPPVPGIESFDPMGVRARRGEDEGVEEVVAYTVASLEIKIPAATAIREEAPSPR